MRRSVLGAALLVAALLVVISASANQTQHRQDGGDTGDTVVTFTFDDIWEDQRPALDVLEQHQMNATIYAISSRVSARGSLGLLDLKGYVQHGFEVGGHTVDHVDLTTVSADEAAHQVCDDRVKLINMGFELRSFAYPHGAHDPAVERLVHDCGYDSGRALPGLRSPGYGCLEGCPPAESIPPMDPYVIRTPTTVRDSTTVEMLKTYVTQAEESGGGWVPLVFHHICDNGCADNSVSIATFSEFVDWLDERPTTTKVQTVGRVMHPPPSAAMPPMSTASAVTLWGRGIGQTEVMAAGLAAGLLGMASYRLLTRKNRYVTARE